MAITSYSFLISQTANTLVDTARLSQEIVAAALGENVHGVDEDGTNIRVVMAAAITESALLTVIEAHEGAKLTEEVLRALVKVVGIELAITPDATWQNLGEIVFVPRSLGNPLKLLFRVIGVWRCDDGAAAELAQLRVVEVAIGGGERVLNSTPFSIPDGSWSFGSFDTDVALSDSSSLFEYRLDGRRNGSTSADVQEATFSIEETV